MGTRPLNLLMRQSYPKTCGKPLYRRLKLKFINEPRARYLSLAVPPISTLL